MFSHISPLPKVPIVYSPDYNITFFGLEFLHPFDSQKYRRVHDRLTAPRRIPRETGFGTLSSLFSMARLPPLLHHTQFHTPEPPTSTDLGLTHSKTYLDNLENPTVIAQILEIPFLALLPISWVRTRVLDPMLLATGGSKMAAELALAEGWAINLGGGFHHASWGGGGGFCVYADISMAVKHVLEGVPPEKRVKKVMIIDLDAHQGNGHERDFMHDNRVHILDCFNSRIFPNDTAVLRAISTSLPVTSYSYETTEPRYVAKVSAALRDAIASFHPDFILYNAGTDCMRGDPLGHMMLSADGIVARDEMVFRMAREVARCPIVMVLSGGYQRGNAAVIAKSIENLVGKFDLLRKMA
ncbi:hypothetical protein BC938DRAFT_483565 [Jimgerdemannia flammicorona]|uniref:Histone deacetylase domain-containing protein n=1 Tax=Jimgerdemannia flammicorona TaxID=994334 RepID=A0A433QVP8_9FUNG|nr:hypothetical protein BC938DRAFT_483565 [Jimgerdemannia flammicorona]